MSTKDQLLTKFADNHTNQIKAIHLRDLVNSVLFVGQGGLTSSEVTALIGINGTKSFNFIYDGIAPLTNEGYYFQIGDSGGLIVEIDLDGITLSSPSGLDSVRCVSRELNSINNVVVLSWHDSLKFPNLPTVDPHVVNAVWNNAGVLKISAG